MKAPLIVISILFSSFCYAQTESDNDSIRLNKERTEQLLNYKLQKGTHDLDKKVWSDDNSSLYKANDELDVTSNVLDMNIPPLKIYEYPLHDYLANPVGNPFADDYIYNGYSRITDRDWITTRSEHTTFPALGSLSLINVNYNYQFSDRLSGSAGTYGTRYYYNMNPNYDFGVNAALSLELTDRISVVGFGQYSARGNINKVGGDNAWLFPQTHYGGAAIFKISDTFGIESGVMRELNTMTGKWRTIPIFAPVFFKSKSR